VELSGGLSAGRSVGAPAIGWNASAAANATDSFGLVAEFGNYRKSFQDNAAHTGSNVRGTLNTYLFGPRISLRLPEPVNITFFAHVLPGIARSRVNLNYAAVPGSLTETRFAIAAGAGFDVNATRNVAIRLFQADFLRTRFRGTGDNSVRYSGGIVLRY
jgi:hypothetical protein